MHEQVAQWFQALTNEEKAALCAGKDFWHLLGVERLGIPSIMLTDGPHGLRKQKGSSDHLGLNESVPSTCFPPACLSACSFDEALLEEMGKAIGEECIQEEVALILGPGINIKRSPLCGRNFEYFSEDPFLSGKMASAWIKGVQSQGIQTSLKHYACNNQEAYRMTGNSIVDDRALREIYLAGFEMAVKEAKPASVMCSYNLLNGTYACESQDLLTTILRDTWGFEGMVVSDWGAVNDRIACLKAGMDLEMPPVGDENTNRILKALKDGKLTQEELNQAVLRILEVIAQSLKVKKQSFTYDIATHHALAKKVASASAVLLKNDNHMLPLKTEDSIAIIGALAVESRYQGAGSSKIHPHHVDHAFDVLANRKILFEYAQGYALDYDDIDESLQKIAVDIASTNKKVVLFLGLPAHYETEGRDRTHMRLPKNQIALLEAVFAVNENVAVVLFGGSAVEMPWLTYSQALLQCYLPGSAGSGVAIDLLFGNINPSGKLAETYPMKLEDTPSYSYFPGNHREVAYKESIYVGYRYYDKANKSVLFPFGYGLSYSEFTYTNMQLSAEKMQDNKPLTVKAVIENIGAYDGAEIVQLYVGQVDSAIFKPMKELKGFVKVVLQQGEKKEVTFTLNRRSFAYYNAQYKEWMVESGVYSIMIGSSSKDIHLIGTVEVKSTDEMKVHVDFRKELPGYYELPTARFSIADEQFAYLCTHMNSTPKHEAFHTNSTLGEIKDTFVGKQMIKMINKQMFDMIDEKDDAAAMAKDMMMDMPLRSLAAFSNGELSIKQIEGVVQMLNGKTVSGLWNLVKK